MSRDVLAEIVEETRRALADPDYAGGVPAAPPHRPASLRAAIERDRVRGALLLEFKRRSPGAKDPNLPARTPEEFVRLGEAAGATGFSCLASRPRFDGAPRDVAAIVQRTRCPVLFKEFVIDPVQLDVAARTGASAVLLLARLAEPAYRVPIADLAGAAHDRGLEVLLEFHRRAELSLAEGVPADMFGVNTRDLASLEIRHEVAAETLRAAGARRPMLGLSGVATPDDARALWRLGVDGLLVGSAFARSSDPVAWASTLRRPPEERP